MNIGKFRIVKRTYAWKDGPWHIYDSKGNFRAQGHSVWEAIRRLFNW